MVRIHEREPAGGRGFLLAPARHDTSLNFVVFRNGHRQTPLLPATQRRISGHKGHRTVQQAAEIVMRLATLDASGPTGGYFDEDGLLPW